MVSDKLHVTSYRIRSGFTVALIHPVSGRIRDKGLRDFGQAGQGNL